MTSSCKEIVATLYPIHSDERDNDIEKAQCPNNVNVKRIAARYKNSKSNKIVHASSRPFFCLSQEDLVSVIMNPVWEGMGKILFFERNQQHRVRLRGTMFISCIIHHK